jgi:molybdopterin synthase sulfur carrier subunit
MSVTLTLPAVLSRLADGQRTIDTAGATVRDALDDVTSRYPGLAPRLRDESGAQYAFVTIYRNDEDIRFSGGLATRLSDGDEIVVVPAIAGG